MQPHTVRETWPYPVAAVYADLDDPAASPPLRREALFFCAYQLMRTVGLALVGQYLTQEPPTAEYKASQGLNRAIAGLRTPHFADWITLLHSLHRHADALGLDFFPDFAGAMTALKAQRIDIPPEIAGGQGWQRLTLLDAFQALRNSTQHAGLKRDDACRAAVAVFRPHLDRLLELFAFLNECDLLVLHSPLTEDLCRVQTLRGCRPPQPEDCEPDDDLFRAFETSPVVLRARGGRLQPLFPLFHAHLEGEPLRCYDGFYLHDDPKMRRRTIYYLGTGERLALDDAHAAGRVRPPAPADAAERLRGLLDARQVPWKLRREQVAPWTLRDTANDYARRTFDDVLGIKYLPACYLDRPALSGPLWQLATDEAPARRALLLSGRAGSGKTALLCDLVRRLLEEHEDHLVFFLRGDGLLRELPGGNLLLSNLLHKIGLDAGAFAGFAEFFAHLEARARQDALPGRRFVIVLDALNEAPAPEQVLREALELVAAGQAYPWLRVVLSARDEFLLVWSGRRGELEANPFHAVRRLFVPPPEDPARPARPEDPPAWFVPAFRPEEAETVYRRYQEAHAADPASPACRTAWEQIVPATRAGLLTVPLYLDLWMRAFDGREAPAVSGERELFEAYLADLRGRFDGFWPGMGLVLDHALKVGRMELNDADANELRDAWQRARTEGERRTQFSPLEVACACGVMQKRTTEEGGGYRIPHQGLRELLIYERLRERDPGLGRESLRRWLGLPPLEELAGALARIAEDLWRAGRAADLALLAEEAVGATALERMLAGRLEREPVDEVFRRRLQEMLEALQGEPEAGRRVADLVLFGVPSRLEGLAVTEGLRVLWDAALPWLERRAAPTRAGQQKSKRFILWRWLGARASPNKADLEYQRDLSVSYNKLGDVHGALGQGEEALRYYREALHIAERLCRAEPGRADYARDLSVSYNKLGDVHRALGQGEEALRYYREALALRERLCRAEPGRADLTWDLVCSYVRLGQLGGQRHLLEQARDLLRALQRQNRLPHQEAVEGLGRLEDMLRTDAGPDAP